MPNAARPAISHIGSSFDGFLEEEVLLQSITAVALGRVLRRRAKGRDRDTAMMTKLPVNEHYEVVEPHHRFSDLVYSDEVWAFDHLEPFVMRTFLDITSGPPVGIDVVVLFSNHCFTREAHAHEAIVEDHVVMDGNTRRVLDRARYDLSRTYLPHVILDLPNRHIQVADATRPNFVTFEIPPTAAGRSPQRYGVFFEVRKDAARKKRILLRVQSAYVLESPSKRLLKADKMRFHVLLKRAYTQPK